MPRSLAGTETSHHFQSDASLLNFLPEADVINVESRSKAATFLLFVGSSSVSPWPSYRPTSSVAGPSSSGARSDQTVLGWSFFWEVGLKKSATAPSFPQCQPKTSNQIEVETGRGQVLTRDTTLGFTLRWRRREGRVVIVGCRSFGGRHYGEKAKPEEGFVDFSGIAIAKVTKWNLVMNADERKTSLAQVHRKW